MMLYRVRCHWMQVLHGVRADQRASGLQRDRYSRRVGLQRSPGEGCYRLRRVSAVGDATSAGNALPWTRGGAQADALEGRDAARLPRSMGDEVTGGRLPVQRAEPQQLHSRLTA